MIKNFDSNVFAEFYEYNESNRNKVMSNFHYHDYYEIYYLVSGKRKYLINYNVFNIEAGDIVLVDKRDLHMATNLDGWSCQRIVVNFNDDFISGCDREFKIALECFKNNHIKLPVTHKKKINSIFNNILREYNSDDAFSKVLLKNYICELLYFLYRCIHTEQVISTEDESGTSIEKAIRYIYNNYHEKLTLDGISKICHMNPSYFSRLFKKTTGINLIAYINTIRIKKASSLLSNTDMSVLEIAQSCGFDNVQHFCSTFKKAKGLSARQFRKENNIDAR